MIGNEEYVNNTLEILKAFLMHGEPQGKDKRKIDGYGLKMDDFLHKFKNKNNESYSSATKRMFAPRKNELLSNRYITPIRSKGKQTKYYSITPIGIAYLCQNFIRPTNLITEYFNQIIKYLIFYHETTKPKPGYAKLLENHHRMFQIHDNTKLSKKKEIFLLWSLFIIMKYVKYDQYAENERSITLSYPLDYTEINYGTYLFTHGEKNKDLFLELHIPSQKTSDKLEPFEGYSDTTEKEIYQKIATFIIKAFFYRSLTNKIFSHLFKIFENPSKSSTTQFNKELRIIPKEYLKIADDFLNELNSILELNVAELGKIKNVYSDQLLSNVS